MPELPEVETIRIQLQKFLVGKKITGVEVKTPKSFPNDKKLVIGAKVKDVRRFGKVTVIDLSNNYSLLIHLKLTGQLLINGDIGPHTRVVIGFEKNLKLVFNDLRIFGWIRIEKSDEIEKERFIVKLGPEPPSAKASEGQALTLDLFKQILAKTNRPIKIVLMDQEKISGVGNIYANDALWEAGMDPRRKSLSLSISETESLYNSILKVLNEGIKYGGASDQHYIKPDGTKGEYQNHFLVYGRKGEPCLKCKTKIEKIFLGGRGTFLCPNCQS
jgi:formamidopyrimidine-DNA glycosylase